MRRYYLLFTVILSTIISFSFIQTTKSQFATIAQSMNNSFTAASTFPSSPTPTNNPQLHIVINELIPQASNSAEWVELFNPTNNTIDISGWTLVDKNSSPSAFPQFSSIPSNGYAIVIPNPSFISVPNGVSKIQLSSTSIAAGLIANNDKLVLKDNTGVIIDQLSWGGNTDIFTLPSPSGVKTLARIPNGTDTDSASNWIATASATIGEPNQ